MKNKIILLLILLSANILLAQNEQLKVLYGQYPMGRIFYPSDTIRSKNNIEPIILIAQNGGFVILRERGKWKISDLYQKLIIAQKNNPFPELFIGEINPKRDALLKLGNVERCPPPEVATCTPIILQILFDTYKIKWLRDLTNNQKYQVKLKNAFDEILDSLITQDTLYQIKFDKHSSIETMFKVEIRKIPRDSLEVSCAGPLTYNFNYLTSKHLQEKKAQFQAFVKSLKIFPPALAHLHKGLWFYENEFYFDAFQEYSAAHKLLPKSKALYFVLGEFLARHSYHWTTVKVFPNWRSIL